MLKFIQESLESKEAIIFYPTSLLFQNLITRVYGNVCAVNIIGATSGKKKLTAEKFFFSDEKALIHTNSIKRKLTFYLCV